MNEILYLKFELSSEHKNNYDITLYVITLRAGVPFDNIPPPGGTWGGTLFALTTRDNTHDSCEKMAGCAEEPDVVDESDEEIKIFFGIKRVFRYNISFIDPSLAVFGEGIITSGKSPREVSSLKEIFRRIPLAPGL